MGHSYGLPTIKALFAQAVHCAYPDCVEPLVFEDARRGIRTIAVQIAHIRSEKPGGPRYDAGYPRELLNTEENLLLLCGKHHTPVDQHGSVFTTDELLAWKAAQVAQVGGTVVSDADLANLVRTLESTLSALYDALRVVVTVDVVGGRFASGGLVVMPLEGLAQITLPEDADPTLLLGVKVINKGSAGIDVTSAGIQIDVGHPDEILSSWIFGGPWCKHGFPHRLAGRSTEHWYVDGATITATITELARKAQRAPLRFRPSSISAMTRERRVSGEAPFSCQSGRKESQRIGSARWAQRKSRIECTHLRELILGKPERTASQDPSIRPPSPTSMAEEGEWRFDDTRGSPNSGYSRPGPPSASERAEVRSYRRTKRSRQEGRTDAYPAFFDARPTSWSFAASSMSSFDGGVSGLVAPKASIDDTLWA